MYFFLHVNIFKVKMLYRSGCSTKTGHVVSLYAIMHGKEPVICRCKAKQHDPFYPPLQRHMPKAAL